MTGIGASSAASGALFTTVDRAAVEAEAIRKLAVAVGQNTADFVAPADAAARDVIHRYDAKEIADAGDPAAYQKLLAIAATGIA